MIDDEIKDIVNKLCIKYKPFYALDRSELLKRVMSSKHNYSPDKAPAKNYFIEVAKRHMSIMRNENIERTKAVLKRKIKIKNLF